MNISVTIEVFDLNFSMYALKVPLEGSVSQIFDLGLNFYFMSKTFKAFLSKSYKIRTRA